MMRKLALVLVGVGATLLLTACQALGVGILGVAVDDAGPVVVVAWCEGEPPAVLVLSHQQPLPERERSTADPDWVEEARYVPDRPPEGDMLTLSLRAPAGWDVDPVPAELRDGVRYQVGGRPEDSRHSYGSITFDTDDLADLAPGEIYSEYGAVPQAQFLERLDERADCGP